MRKGERQRKPAAALIPPWTQLPATTPQPKRQRGRPKGENTNYDEIAMEVARLYDNKKLQPVRLSCYLYQVDANWWGILLGKEEDGYLLDSVSKLV